MKTKRSIIFIVSFFVSFYVPFAFFFGMSIHIFEDSLSAQQRTPVRSQLGLVCECVQGTPLFCIY